MHTLTREVTARQLRGELATLVNEAAYGGGRIGLFRYGSLVAVLIGFDDFRRLRSLEDDPNASRVETLDEWADRMRVEREAEAEAKRVAAVVAAAREEADLEAAEREAAEREAAERAAAEAGTTRADGSEHDGWGHDDQEHDDREHDDQEHDDQEHDDQEHDDPEHDGPEHDGSGRRGGGHGATEWEVIGADDDWH